MENKKYLLSDEKKELAESMIDIKLYYQGRKFSGKRLGIFSDLLHNLPFFLYDEENLVGSFPNGIISEQFILLNSKNVENLIKNEDKNISSSIPKMLISSILNYIEVNFKINFSKEDIKSFFGMFEDKMKINSITELDKLEKLTYVSNEDILERVYDLKISTADTIKQIIDDNKNGKVLKIVANILLQSQEISDTNNPLSKFKETIKQRLAFYETQNLKDDLILSNMFKENKDIKLSNDNLYELYARDFNFENKEKVKAVLQNRVVENIYKSETILDFLELSKENLVPCSTFLQDADYAKFLENMHIKLVEKFGSVVDIDVGSSTLSLSDKELITNYFVLNIDLTLFQRNIFIDEITNMNKFNKNFENKSKKKLSIYK